MVHEKIRTLKKPEVKFATHVKSDFCMLTLCNFESCFGMNAGFLSGLLETASCELHHTPQISNIFFYSVKSQHFDVSISHHSTTMNILSICIFDVNCI